MIFQTSSSRDRSTRVLLVAIHDVSPAFERQIGQLYALLSGLVDGSKIAMLVVPDYWGAAPLQESPEFCHRLREWSTSGCEMFVHGWYHRDEGSHKGLSRILAGTMTAGAGEFLGLTLDESLRRMASGKALIEDVTGQSAAGFIAPAWLYGKGALAALAQSEFPLAEDHFKVWHPKTGQIVARGPVITWATRTRMRKASSLFFAGLSKIILGNTDCVRIAVHPNDIDDKDVVKSIVKTIKYFSSGRHVKRYSEVYK